jgi:hypothetical protein
MLAMAYDHPLDNCSSRDFELSCEVDLRQVSRKARRYTGHDSTMGTQE